MSNESAFVAHVIVLCINASGEPEFHSCEPTVTQAQLENGEHYQLAKDNAKYNGFAEPMIAFDGTDPAAKQLTDLGEWIGQVSPCTDPPEPWTIRMCEIAGISIMQAQEEEIRGMWDWLSPNGDACDQSYDERQDAALAAIEHHFPREEWQRCASEGDTRLGYPDWVLHQADQFADEHVTAESVR